MPGLSGLFTPGLKAESEREREREREIEKERETLGRRGWHVAGETAGCLPTGSDAAAGAVVGEHTSLCEADIIFFVSLHVDNEFCPHSLPRCDFIQYAATYADPGISNWLAVRFLLY